MVYTKIFQRHQGDCSTLYIIIDFFFFILFYKISYINIIFFKYHCFKKSSVTFNFNYTFMQIWPVINLGRLQWRTSFLSLNVTVLRLSVSRGFNEMLPSDVSQVISQGMRYIGPVLAESRAAVKDVGTALSQHQTDMRCVPGVIRSLWMGPEQNATSFL